MKAADASIMDEAQRPRGSARPRNTRIDEIKQMIA
jgi:hypothetical protein